ncbi:MAG: hypothetical protein D3922_05405 [Candidatus Electrothrix sp. AR1]|nr:hypothetical protein [Candidatus Electrothrix sp. AR1]
MTAMVFLAPFPCSFYDMTEHRKKFNIVSYLSPLPCFLFVFYDLKMIATGYLTICCTPILFDSLRQKVVGRQLGKTWVVVCRDQGCQVESLYAALQGKKTVLPEYSNDPVGIFTPKRVQPATYAREANEVLRRNAVDSNIAWNRGLAALILSHRHSKFGRFIFSKNVNGFVPPRDPRKPVKRKIIEKAASETDIRPEEIPAQIASLNEFLGWDVEKGCPRK